MNTAKFCWLVLGLFSLVSFSTPNRIETLIRKEIRSVLKLESYTKETVLIPEQLAQELPDSGLKEQLYTIVQQEEIKGYYFLGKAFGKADFFDFMVIFGPDLDILKVKILVYRESHGGEIASRRWLRQFRGVLPLQPFSYPKDIAAISGATISARSLTKSINQLLETMTLLRQNKVI
ncbi:MAG: FMN-binding protein [Lutibacter sp.]|jgi:Na+-translocating ferredoxin:NAD+ oxidoreductase RnfG subunit|nr:FMN-binding protein [Lutibacter sp.]